jgi:RNA polymerase subunit RPABC4/transcription elongation factor Spt4
VHNKFGTPELPYTASCPNCHVRITPGTQICYNCNTRICSYCYGVIPTITATVCPNCGKRDFLKKSIKDIRLEGAINKQITESLITETEYKCPICNEKMLLITGGTLKCQSRSCGYIIAMKEFMTIYGKENPEIKSFVNDPEFALQIEQNNHEYSMAEKLKQVKNIKSTNSTELQQFTTSIETKATDQYFWKKEKMPKTGRKRLFRIIFFILIGLILLLLLLFILHILKFF